ncbi:hypothetical protein OIU84_029058 [Salix udensis]|uniref:Uncharacterized protein n=1 Tax=Salix udensis TaxID=889485 RepID=A0AAD6KEI3_9ROSI|nr:hypothetical protein OIU84_029058 [Salix udensis]
MLRTLKTLEGQWKLRSVPEELNVSRSPLVGRLDETVELEENMLIQESAVIMEYPQKFVSECPTSARFVETVEPLDMSNFCTRWKIA